MAPLIIRSPYMLHAHSDAESMIATAASFLDGVDYDSLVGTGLSGALVVPLLGRAFDKEWMVVRKKGEDSHAAHRGAEGTLGCRWVFVDDLIDSGATYAWVREQVRRLSDQAGHKTVHVGNYLYANFGRPEFEDVSALAHDGSFLDSAAQA